MQANISQATHTHTTHHTQKLTLSPKPHQTKDKQKRMDSNQSPSLRSRLQTTTSNNPQHPTSHTQSKQQSHHPYQPTHQPTTPKCQRTNQIRTLRPISQLRKPTQLHLSSIRQTHLHTYRQTTTQRQNTKANTISPRSIQQSRTSPRPPSITQLRQPQPQHSSTIPMYIPQTQKTSKLLQNNLKHTTTHSLLPPQQHLPQPTKPSTTMPQRPITRKPKLGTPRHITQKLSTQLPQHLLQKLPTPHQQVQSTTSQRPRLRTTRNQRQHNSTKANSNVKRRQSSTT